MIMCELFSGIGASAQAMTDIGVKFTSIQCDIDEQAVNVYNAIHGDTPNLGDITKVSRLPICDIATISAPCQTVSIAGTQTGMVEGSGTASSLVWEALRIIKAADRLPRYLVWENVKGWLFSSNINEFNRLVNELSALGYSCSWQILNAKDYGVPQSRERIFMVCALGKNLKFEWPKPCPDGRVLRDVLEDDVDESYYLTPERIATFERHRTRMESAGYNFGWNPQDGSKIATTTTTNPDRYYSNWLIVSGNLNIPTYLERSNRVYSPDGIAPCMVARSGGGVQPHIDLDDRIRKLTPRETWRLQGFPDSAFDIASKMYGKTALYRMSGNSIAVPCLREIFKNIILNRFRKTVTLDSFFDNGVLA